MAISLETIHPASILTPAEELSVSEKVFDGSFDLETTHPASLSSVARLVQDGYGELILRVKEGDSFRPVTKEEYDQAYWIFRKYVVRVEAAPMHMDKSRIEMMREELRAINPNMVGTFIPRTLYDLIFIRKSIEEDIETEKKIHYVEREHPTEAEREHISFNPAYNTWCSPSMEWGVDWGIDSFGVVHPPRPVWVRTLDDVKEQIDKIRNIGYRLNTAACEVLQRKDPNKEHLRLDTIQAIVQDHIQFLADFHKNPRSSLFVSKKISQLTLSAYFSEGRTLDRPLFPMAVSSEKIAKLIQRAALLESQESSINKIVIYRGGDLAEDGPMKGGAPYCISFGSSLFAGCANDPGACAFHYSRDRTGYAFVIDPTKETAEVFRTPYYTALESLFGLGEAWHYRFKVSREEGELTGVDADIGIGLAPPEDPNRFNMFLSPLSRQQLIEKFEDLKKHNLVVLKPSGSI